MKVIKIGVAQNEVSAQELAAFVDSIHMFSKEQDIDKDIANMIANLPSTRSITMEMDQVQLRLLRETVGHIWRKLSGNKLTDVKVEQQSTDMGQLDGNYWFLPGEVLLHGFNHFSIAKNHRDLICRLLDINPFVFEHNLQSNPDRLIWLVLSHGGVRTIVDRGKSAIYMQTIESSWPWVRDKLKKMYHKKRLVKVLDPNIPYEGWSSGVSVVVKSQPDWVSK